MINLKGAKAAQGVAPAKKAKKSTDAKNTASIKEKVKKAKDSMYIYPKGLDGLGKKKFRAAARRKLEKGLKILKSKKTENKAEFLEKIQKWASKTYSLDSMPKF